MAASPRKRIHWLGDTRETLRGFPDDVQDEIGFALYQAEIGGKHPSAKPLKGKAFPGATVMEIVSDHDGDTYRAVYTVRLKGYLFVLHAFQKKSKHGIATPKREIDLIKLRLQVAVQRAKALAP